MDKRLTTFMVALITVGIMFFSENINKEEWESESIMENYKIILHDEMKGMIQVYVNHKTCSLPLIKVYELIGSDIQYDGSTILIKHGNERLYIKAYESKVYNEQGEQMLWLPPGGICEIRCWIDDDIFVDEESLFALLYDTTDWTFQIDEVSRQVVFKRRFSEF